VLVALPAIVVCGPFVQAMPGEAGSSLKPPAVNHSNQVLASDLEARLRARLG
ncbi:hypothetical protein V7S43_014848, partial [Phytophthora oleae]